MRAKHFYLKSLEAQKEAMGFLMGVILDGKVKVTFSDAGTKSAKQRGLQWMWHEDIAKSGKGGSHFDTEDDVDLFMKYKFGRPIMIRDSDYFSDLWEGWLSIVEAMEDKEERIKFFIRDHVRTEKFTTSQMAEYLTSIQKFCITKGIFIREPEFRHLLDG
jgi:hypothetical protein